MTRIIALWAEFTPLDLSFIVLGLLLMVERLWHKEPPARKGK